MATKNVIAEAPAQEQVDLLLDFYDIEVEDLKGFKNPDAKVQEAIQSSIKRLKRYVMKGFIEISNEGGLKITQHLKFKMGETTQLNYGLLTGKAKMAMAHAAEDDFHGRIYAMVGSLVNLSPQAMSSLIGTDSSVAECLGAIFLMV